MSDDILFIIASVCVALLVAGSLIEGIHAVLGVMP